MDDIAIATISYIFASLHEEIRERMKSSIDTGCNRRGGRMGWDGDGLKLKKNESTMVIR